MSGGMSIPNEKIHRERKWKYQNKFHIPICTIPCGLVARIRRFHRRGRGSIPRKGGSNFSRKEIQSPEIATKIARNHDTIPFTDTGCLGVLSTMP